MIPPHQSHARQLPPKGKPPLQSAPSSNVASDFNAILVVIHCKGNFAKRLPLGGKAIVQTSFAVTYDFDTLKKRSAFPYLHGFRKPSPLRGKVSPQVTDEGEQSLGFSAKADNGSVTSPRPRAYAIGARSRQNPDFSFFTFCLYCQLSTVNCQLSSHRAESALTLRKGLLWQTNSSSRAESPLWAKFRSAA